MATHAQRLERWGEWSTRRLPSTTATTTTIAQAQVADNTAVDAATKDAISRQLRALEARRGEHRALSRVEAERLRVRVELASIRHDSTAPASLPPTGREFDEPDSADESAYDALEKAYNLAFAVTSPERLERTADDERKMRPEFSVAAIEKDLRATLAHAVERKRRVLTDAELLSSTDAIPAWKQEALDSRLQAIEKLRSAIRRPEPERDHVDVWRQTIIYSRGSIVEHARSMATTRVKRLKVLLHLAEACRNRVLGRPKARVHAENGFVRAAAPLKVQIPASAPMPPRSSPNDDGGEQVPAESKAVGDFLVAELSSLASYLTLGYQQSTTIHRTAAATSTHLWREYQRALSDFETESRRSKESRSDYTNRDALSLTVEEPSLNPFQRHGEGFDNSWKSSLKSVEYVDCQSGAQREDPCLSPQRESDVSRSLASLYEGGLNGIIIHREKGVRAEVASFIVQVQRKRSTKTIHLLVTQSSRLSEWSNALSGTGIILRPEGYGDRDHPDALSTDLNLRGPPTVLLVGVETLSRNFDSLATYPLHLCIFDLDARSIHQPHDPSIAVWPSLLSLRCRQRLLIAPPSLGVDVRTLALFVYPMALCSRRKIMAWNCASLTKRNVASIVSTINTCVVCADGGSSILAEWSASIEENTLLLTQRETKTLNMLVKQVARVPSAENGVIATTDVFYPNLTPRVRVSKKTVPRLGNALASAEDVLRLSTQAKELPLKRRLHSSTRRYRKRVSRCGKCAGCLAEDCMTCGHCQDMKKYGGPGLRKQSCKKRKCIKPKTWGLTRKKARRGDGATGTESRDASEDEYSDSGESDAGSTEHGGDSALSSDESEAEQSGARPGTPRLDDGSDSGYDSSHFSDEMVDTTSRDPHDSTEDEKQNGGLFEGHSRAGRSRIMRCGKCRGCTSGDCMKCIHCRDMKKYGGLGQRKQSCKYRKCIAPKVVLLNQARDKFDDDPEAAETGSSHGGDEESNGTKKRIDVDTTELLLSTSRLDSLHVLQECELVVRKFQFFSCDVCCHAFISQKLLDRHFECVHNESDGRTDWEKTAEQLLLHPAHQLGCLIASRRSINPNWQAPPIRAYAKLVGTGFEYFLLKPFAVLGRLSPRWTNFYQSRGIATPRGLAGGSVDCHLGDDAMIANSHALIQWDHAHGQFTIECLSLRSSLSVNGQDVHFSSRPRPLQNHDLVQIGACIAYFLLPRPSDAEPSSQVAAGPQIPRAEMRAWLQTAATKRRARRAQDEAIATKIQALTSRK